MDDLDRIPWKKLTHAYGSAEDVPDLLRALPTASPEAKEGESPLWCLFGNILHQGTVYEATSYAVPFLIRLVAKPSTPDREGILDLLAGIAQGIAQGESRRWAAKAHEAVLQGFEEFVRITNETSDVSIAAAHVLAQLPERAEEVGTLLRRLLEKESRHLHRAGLLLLCGQSADRSDRMISTLGLAVGSGDAVERFAASIALARLKPQRMPAGAREAIMEAILTEEYEEPFYGLPWDAAGDVGSDRDQLWACLSLSDLQIAAETLITAIETGHGTGVKVTTLIEILFPSAKRGRTKQVRACDLSPLQQGAVRALAKALEGKKRIFYGHFPQWGLPDTMREWRALAAGLPPPEVDMTLPLLADPAKPRRPLQPGRLAVGDKVLHRHFGLGVVTEIGPHDDNWTRLTVLFEEEGTKTLHLPSMR